MQTRPPEPLRGHLASALPGRSRIVLAATPERWQLEHAAHAIAAVRGVRSVEIRPRTGSVVIVHDGDAAALWARLADGELLTLESRPSLGAIGSVAAQLSQADGLVARLSGNRFDLASAAFLTLVGAGLVQLARGRIAGPAISLWSQAASLALVRLRSAGGRVALPPPPSR